MIGAIAGNPVEQGQLLRVALAEHSRFALKANQVVNRGKDWSIDVDEIVKQFVPEGCTFDYAESVLRNAGFTFEPRPTPETPNRIGGEYEFDVNAFLGYVYTRERFEGLPCIVALRPAGPYDYSVVHRVLTTCGATVLGDPRQAHTGKIDNVSDLAFMEAAYRAIETSRPDALIHDPLAAKLAGSHGEKIVQQRPKWSAVCQWLLAIRTSIVDKLIENAITQGTTTILNLGAGLDTRPYRMDLPDHIRWIEVDYPKVIWLKERVLAGEKSRCNLERFTLDLTDALSRKQLLDNIASKSKKTLVLTENVIPYLSERDVASIAGDLRRYGVFQYWIVDYFSSEFRQCRLSISRRMRMQKAPILFEPKDYFGFFLEHGWRIESIRHAPEQAGELNRPIHLPLSWRWQMGVMNFINEGRLRHVLLKSTACVVLEPLATRIVRS
jgi:methyltransferase (TIGR00027 family)